MNKKFTREVLRLLPGYSVAAGHFFFEFPVVHILAGFCWEMPRGGIYIWTYAFPLYDLTDFVHLGYGERLSPPYGWIPVVGKERLERELAEEFVQQISPYRETVSHLRDLDGFIEYMGNRNLQNPIVRQGYALSLIMAGDESEAMKQLELCLQASHKQEFADEISKMIEAVHSGTARDVLQARERAFKEKLGIQEA